MQQRNSRYCKRCVDIANRLKNDYSQCPDMWQKIQLIVIKIMSLGYTYALAAGQSGGTSAAECV
ncbi:hypothetical protein [Symbiopectobacterium sp. RP]|uniref:hypothetical protein n=1 Tax=Symbiopectobacterium sp. RP TaxID=3248553 RepID=UPI003D27159E